MFFVFFSSEWPGAEGCTVAAALCGAGLIAKAVIDGDRGFVQPVIIKNAAADSFAALVKPECLRR